ncbi:MAG: hypothetical protein IKS23_02675 [Alphaproteobacteria bacterium]|nr:hypothetical protein [Alphaproteobacteria bacterium]
MKNQNTFNLIHENVFKEYQSIYENILTKIYPSKGSTGFPERNLSVNFSKAYEKLANKNELCAYTWFEFQFGDNNNNHLDAVIINDKTQEMFIIESKRYKSKRKRESIFSDIQRMPSFISDIKGRILFNIDNINRSDYKYYGIILADVWTETSPKRKICNTYQKNPKMDEDTFYDFFKKNKGTLNFKIDKVCCKEQSFANTENIPDWIKQNYHLVSMWWQFKL